MPQIAVFAAVDFEACAVEMFGVDGGTLRGLFGVEAELFATWKYFCHCYIPFG